MTTDERRIEPRVPIALRSVIHTGTRRIGGIKTLDVSSGGCLLDSPKAVEPDTLVMVDIHSNQGLTKPAVAKVLRCDRAFWGQRQVIALQFVESQDVLLDLVKRESIQLKSRVGRVDWSRFRRDPSLTFAK